MIRKKEEGPGADIDLYVPKLLEYLKANYVRPKPEIRYSLPVVPGKTNSLREPEKQADSGGEWFGEAASNEPAEQEIRCCMRREAELRSYSMKTDPASVLRRTQDP